MSTQTFVPEIWEAALLTNLNNEHVYAQCFNNDFEGNLTYGASVHITSIGRITISDYTRNADIADPEILNLAGMDMVIDQGKVFNFAVDDVDQRQARGQLIGPASKESSWALADATDLFLANKISNALGNTLTATTIGGAAGQVSAYDTLVQMDVKLTETNTPRGDRWAVVPPWYEGLLRLDERFISFGTPGNLARLNGEPVGKASGMTIYMSNNCPVAAAAATVPTSGTPGSSTHQILAGYKGAATFGEQIEKTEAYRPQKRFADAVKGLHVYGAKITRPNNLIGILATRGSLVGS